MVDELPFYTDAYGIDISYREWIVPEPRAIVQIVHGIGEHSGRYAELAGALTAAGYSVYADDHRGHGHTAVRQHAGRMRDLGRLGPGGLRATELAVHRFTEIIAAANPGVPIVLLGHSWGSFMAQKIVDRHARDYAAVILSGSSLRIPGYLNAGDLNKPFRAKTATGLEWLSRDPAVWTAFHDDPLTFEEPLADRFGIADTLRLAGLPARGLPRDLPLLLIVGSADTVGGARGVRALEAAYRRRSGLTDVRVEVYEGARHELFQETNRAEVTADVLAWLDERLPTGASGASSSPEPILSPEPTGDVGGRQ